MTEMVHQCVKEKPDNVEGFTMEQLSKVRQKKRNVMMGGDLLSQFGSGAGDKKSGNGPPGGHGHSYVRDRFLARLEIWQFPFRSKTDIEKRLTITFCFIF